MLGPIELTARGRVLPVGGRLAEALLALLATGPLPVDRLIADLWPGDPPASARTQVHGLVHGIRRALDEAGGPGREVLVTSPAGYRLELPDGGLDAELFRTGAARGRQALRDGDAVGAATELRAALDRWRGPAFDGLDLPRLRAHAAALAELRGGVLLDWADAALRAGRPEEVAYELGPVLAEQPYLDGVRERFMLALARTGRTADALATYREGWRRSVDELGVEPAARLRELHERLLAGDAGDILTPARGRAAAPRQLPAAPNDFSGRDTERAALTAALTGAGPAVVVVGGMGGVGKTALVAAVGAALRDRFPDGQLFVSLRGTLDRPVSPAAAVRRCLESLGVLPAAVPPDLDSRAARLRDLLADRRVLLVADDAAGEAQLRPLLPTGPGTALVATSRQQLAGLPATARIGLAPFDPGEALELLSAVVGPQRVAAERAAAERLAGYCDGLPLAVRIVAARLARTPDGTVAELADRLAVDGQRLDWLQLGDLGVRASLSAGLVALPAECRLLLSRLAALRPPEVSGWVAAALLDADPGRAERALEALLDAHLVTPAGRGVTGPRYVLHDLIRLVVRDPDDAGSPAALGRALAGWSALAGVAATATHGSSAAHLDPEPADPWTPPEPVRALVAAAPRRWFDEETPALVEVAGQAADLGSAAVAWTLAQRLTGHLQVRCRLAEWESVLADARRAAEAAGDRAGLACVLRFTADARSVPGDFDGGLAAALRARELYAELGDHRGGALCTTRAGFCLRMTGRTAEGAALIEDALQLAAVGGTPDAEGYVLHALSLLQLDRGDTTAGRRSLERSVELAGRHGRAHDRCDRLITLGIVLVRGGLLDDADRVLREAGAAGAGLEDDCLASHAELTRAEVLLRLGRPAEAEPLARRSAETESRVQDLPVEADARRLLGEILLDLGRPAEAVPELTASAGTADRIGRAQQAGLALRLLLDCALDLRDEALAADCRRRLETAAVAAT